MVVVPWCSGKSEDLRLWRDFLDRKPLSDVIVPYAIDFGVVLSALAVVSSWTQIILALNSRV